MKQLKAFPSFVLVLVVACGSDSNPVNTDSGPTPDAPRQVRQVTGSSIDTFITQAGPVMVPRDLSALVIEALVPDGSGGYEVFAGTGAIDGTFVIDDVPEGEYLLRRDSGYRVASASVLDLGTVRLGRPDGAAAGAATRLAFDVTGMAAWQEGDNLDFLAPNAPASARFLELGLEPAPAIDDVTLASVLNWSQAGEPTLIDGAKGDVAYLVRHSTQTVAGEDYSAISQSLEAPALTMEDNQTTTVTGVFSDSALDQSVEIGFNPEDWTPAFGDFGPTDIAAPVPNASLFSSPFGTAMGDIGDLELAAYTPVPGDQLHTFSLAYSNPFPSDWTLFATAVAVGFGFIDPPSNSVRAVSFLVMVDSTDMLQDIKPRLAAPAAPMIDGKDLTVPQTSGETPIFSWSAPTLGTVGSYQIRLRHVTVGSPVGRTVATFATSSTSLAIPPGILIPGERYFFDLGSRTEPGVDYDAAPFRVTGPTRDFAQRPTAILTIEP